MTYLDNSATTKPEKEVADKIYEMLTVNFGNPSSFHKAGLDANDEITRAREIIAKSLFCQSEEIYFTSGGTEANNLAIFGAAEAGKRRGNRIVTTAIEHESVLKAADELEKRGFEVIRLMPDSKGRISEEHIFDAVNATKILVTMMFVNNEVGSILPVSAIKKAVKRANAPALIHIDCVQAYSKTEIKPEKLGADLISISSHKIHGAKGVGALYVKKGVRIIPMMFGGEQEKRLRPGTQAAPLIAGFGKAAEMIPDYKQQAEKIKELNAYAKQELLKIDGVIINSPEDGSDYIINLYVPTFMTSQTIVQHLSSQYGVYVSNGSACAKGKKSHVLTAMKISDKIIDKSIRISFSRNTTKEDIDSLINALRETVRDYPI